jgi:ABC-type transport system substrate-binding protein
VEENCLKTKLNSKTLLSIFLILVVAGSSRLLFPAPVNDFLAIPYACGQATQDKYPLNGPRVDELIFKYYASPDASVAAIQRGEIEQLSDLIRTSDIQVLSKDPNINVTFNLQTHYCYVAFNVRRDTLNDVNLRKAIASLVPREQIANGLFGGITVTPMLYEVLPSFGKWYNPNVKAYPFNVDQAKQILDQAGYKLGSDGKYLDPSGKPMRELSFISPTQEEAPTSFEVVRLVTDNMRSIGLSVKQEAVAFDALLTHVYTQHDFDIFFLCVSGLGRYPRWLYDYYHSSLDVPDGDNTPGVHNGELDRLLTQFRYEDQTEDDARQHILRAQEIIADNVWRTPVYSRYEIEALRKGWDGQIVTRGSGYFEPGTWAWLTVHKAGQTFGGTFTSSVGGRVRTLNPMFDSGAYDQKIWNLIYESLVFTNPAGDIIPGLAATWESQDVTLPNATQGRKITYHLNQNITWQDGTRFTSKDVKFSYDYVKQQKIPIWLPDVENVVSVDAPDDYTAVITIKSRSFFSFLDTSSLVIIPEHIWRDVGDKWRTFVPSQENHPTISGLTKEIGTGPFILTEFKAGEFWRMLSNLNHFRRHPDKTFQLEKTSIPDSLPRGDKSDIKITVKSYTGQIVTDAQVTANLVREGKSAATLNFAHVGNGLYHATLDTVNTDPGAYSLVFTISRGAGALTQTTSVTYSLVIQAPFPLIPVTMAIAVILIVAGYVLIRRRGIEKT